jgi:hypothetical protein
LLQCNLGLLNLLLQDALQCDGISSELADTFAQLLDGHLLLVEVKAEQGLVVDVALPLDVEAAGLRRVELLGYGGGGVVQVLEEVWLFHPSALT